MEQAADDGDIAHEQVAERTLEIRRSIGGPEPDEHQRHKSDEQRKRHRGETGKDPHKQRGSSENLEDAGQSRDEPGCRQVQ